MKEEKQQFNVYLTPDTIKKIKHHAIDEQLSLSDLVEKVFVTYLTPKAEQEQTEIPVHEKGIIKLQPMLHVDSMGDALDFFSKLGATVVNGSRDGDWVLLRFGSIELGLLAHPANPEQNEGKVELNFEYPASLIDLEQKLSEAGVTIVRQTSDEGFGYQLQLEGPDKMLIKINQIDPELYQ